jgi:hypothetical protein
MNDPQWLEASRHLAERVLRESPNTDTRLNALAEILLSRPWRDREKAVLQTALAKFESVYGQDTVSAEKLLSVGESKRDTNLSASDVASWMLVASAAMNLDEVLNK